MRVLVVSEKRFAEFKKKDGALLREIEKRCGVKLSFGTEAELRIDAANDDEAQRGSEWVAEQVCRAISLGFEPRRAFKLLSDDYYLEEIKLAKEAVFKILEGKEISTVYSFLEKHAKKTL